MIPSKDIAKLVHLAAYGVNAGLPGFDGKLGPWAPKFDSKGNLVETFCNLFVHYVATGFGYTAFAGLTADEIFDFTADFHNGWITQDEATAQERANAGVMVIAGWKAPGGAHGHVNVIVPGILQASAGFGKKVPECANVGKSVFFGKKISYAFRPDEAPTYFALAGMI